MKNQKFAQIYSVWLMTWVSCLTLAVSPTQAQTIESPSQQSPAAQPNSIPRDREFIRREQAPLPLNRVYQTPIEQFEPAFTDVPRDHWAYEAVTRLFYSGVVKGEPTRTNQPPQSN